MISVSSEIHYDFRTLLFCVPTSKPDWQARFVRLTVGCENWEANCRNVTMNEYARDTHAQDGYARVGWFFLTQGKAALALPWFEADMNLGRLGWWIGLRHAEALAELGRIVEAEERVVAIYGQYPEARNGFASLAWRLHKRLGVSTALGWVDRDIQADRLTMGFSINHAVMLAKATCWLEAFTQVENAYAADVGLKDGYVRLAWIHAEAKDWSAAWEIARRDVLKGRLSPVWRLNIAQLLGRLGAFSEAIVQVELAYSEDVHLRDGFARLGWIYTESENWQAAWDLAGRDVANGRSSPAWCLKSALLLGHLGDFKRAVCLIELAYENDATLQDGFACLAQLVHETNDPLYAVKLLERDMEEGRLSEPRRADLLLLKARLFGEWDGISVSGLVALLEKAIKNLSPHSYPGFADFLDQVKPLVRAVAGGNVDAAKPLRDLLDIISKLALSSAWPVLGIVLATVRGVEPHRKWQKDSLFDGTLGWLSDYRKRLKQTLVDWDFASRYYPALTEKWKVQALLHSLRIAEDMLGRPCGVVGDRLAQYGAVAQLAHEGARSLNIVELGTLFGGSCMLFLLAARDLNLNVHITCVDPFDGYYSQDRDPVSGALVSPKILWENLERIGLPKSAVELKRCLSHEPEALVGLEPGSVDLVLIDAEHSHEGVWADWYNYSPLVRVGGIIIFDDYGTDYPEVTRAVDEICMSEQGWICHGVLGTSSIVCRVERNLPKSESTQIGILC